MEENPKWEYRVQTFGSGLSGPRDGPLMEVLNEWGNEGWEVISANNLDSSPKVRVLARRPLTHAARRYRSMPA